VNTHILPKVKQWRRASSFFDGRLQSEALGDGGVLGCKMNQTIEERVKRVEESFGDLVREYRWDLFLFRTIRVGRTTRYFVPGCCYEFLELVYLIQVKCCGLVGRVLLPCF